MCALAPKTSVPFCDVDLHLLITTAMTTTRILITGGAGFSGSHLADELLSGGYTARALDNLSRHVHDGKRPAYLDNDVELVVSDVRNRNVLTSVLDYIDAVFHLGAEANAERAARGLTA